MKILSLFFVLTILGISLLRSEVYGTSPSGSASETENKSPIGQENAPAPATTGSEQENYPAPTGSGQENSPAPTGSGQENGPAPSASGQENSPAPAGSEYATVPPALGPVNEYVLEHGHGESGYEYDSADYEGSGHPNYDENGPPEHEIYPGYGLRNE